MHREGGEKFTDISDAYLYISHRSRCCMFFACCSWACYSYPNILEICPVVSAF